MKTPSVCLRSLVVRTFVLVLAFAAASTAATVRQLSLHTSDLVYDKVTGLIYASVPDMAGPPYANCVVRIDPATGTLVGDALPVGADPRALALSDDGQFLYVALEGTGEIRRVDVATWSAGLVFALGSEPYPWETSFAEDIAVQPGSPGVIAVSLKSNTTSPRHVGVAVYEDGVRRPVKTAVHTGSNVIAFSDDPAVLYGFNNESSEFGFRRMRVDADGVVETDLMLTPIGGYNQDIEHAAGRIYVTSGNRVDPDQLVIEGAYPVPFLGGVLVEPDPPNSRVYFLSGSSLITFDQASFSQVGAPFAVANVFGNTSSLIRWGAEGLAFRTDQGQVFLLEPPFQDETNDDFANAKVVQGVPFSDNVDTRAATSAPDDPWCYWQGNTVWYSFTPAESMPLDISTAGSNYTTSISVYTGARGSLVQHGCTLQPVLGVALQAGTTYHVMIGSPYVGGDLVLQMQRPVDTDGDGFADSRDNCPLTPNPDQFDWDGDGRGDPCDNCPNQYNPGQEDSDGDGAGDACEDEDGDSVPDLFDNCRAVPNPDQRDSDFDGVGDLCDATPVHDLAVGILNAPRAAIRPSENATATLRVVLRVFNLVNYREEFLATAIVSGLPPGCSLTAPVPVATPIRKLGDKRVELDFAVTCGVGVAPGYYALVVNAFVTHNGPGSDRDSVNNFATTSGLLRVR
jgi:DNA-binding beta-propeller fold protein YncE